MFFFLRKLREIVQNTIKNIEYWWQNKVRRIDLYSSEWCDIIFKYKNKSYGAYVLRQSSTYRHTVALLWVIVFVFLILFLPSLVFQLTKPKMDNIIVTQITAFSKLEKPKDLLQEIKKLKVNIKKDKPVDDKSIVKTAAPVIAKDEEVTVKDENNSQKLFEEKKSEAEKGDDANDKDLIPEQLAPNSKLAENITYEIVDSMPEFPGGQIALFQYLTKNIKYPFWAQRYNMQGEVVTEFIVNKDGSISDCRVTKSAYSYLDIEAIRVVRSMPHWKPALKNKKPIRAKCVLPIVFRLQ